MTKKKFIAKNISKGIAILRVGKVTYTIKPESEITFLAFEKEKFIFPKGIIEIEDFKTEKEQPVVEETSKPKRGRKKSVKIETEEG